MAAILEFRDSVGANNQTGAQTSGTVSAANQARTGFMLQNQGTNQLYVLLGPGTVSTTVYSFILKACTGAADGTGGSFSMMDGNVFRGVITVAGTNVSYSFLEL